MSAFIVDRDTMQRVIFAAYTLTRGDYHRNLPESMKAKTPAQVAKLWARLFRLNAEAVSQRYGEPPSETPPMGGECAVKSITQAYASIRCLIYQCSEGDVPDRPLYNDLVELRKLTAEHIVMGSREFQRAEW